MRFFTRIDGLDLTPGNKSAGFVFAVSAAALRQLAGAVVPAEAWARLNASAIERVVRSGLISAEMASGCGLAQYQGSAVPRSFWVDPGFAGSLGPDPEWLSFVLKAEDIEGALLEHEVEFTPHNVDTPQQALVLLILVQAWSEWAAAHLQLAQNALLKDVP